ncbi:MAG: SGNH/GDSL hydrolase family protein [Xenococcaceae cyanobacterium MO_167.B27]|nr:SGNH/GDSL hydrolase family protein [Xenococcaceae cyanobacterium MO_167.B27]
MIIISSSIPKSASTLIYNYQEDLLALASQNNAVAQEEFNKYSNCGFLRGIYFNNFLTIIFLKIKYGNVVIKTHSKPSFFIKLLIALGLAKATFCYREPRDIILSAIDHGERTRKGKDASGACKNMITIADSLPIVKSWMSNWYQWKEYGSKINDVYAQLEQLPPDTTHLILSVGGNNALSHIGILNENVASSAQVFSKLADISEQFEQQYEKLLEKILSFNLPTVICTIYYPNHSVKLERQIAIAALATFNDVIIRLAFQAGIPLIDLRLTCNETQDYANALRSDQTFLHRWRENRQRNYERYLRT